MKKEIWFKSKTYGWGWTPATWQGWLVTGLYVFYELFLTVLIGSSFDSRPGITSFLFLSSLGVSVLLVICIQYGEKPQWRWGNKKK